MTCINLKVMSLFKGFSILANCYHTPSSSFPIHKNERANQMFVLFKSWLLLVLFILLDFFRSRGSDPANAVLTDSSLGELVADWLAAEISTRRKSWAYMAQEDELEEEEEEEEVNGVDKQSEDVGQSSEQQGLVPGRKTELSRDQREYLRLMNVRRKKDFIFLERVSGKIVNILKGLELHTGVFSVVEQKRIVDFIGELQVNGKKGELKGKVLPPESVYR